MCRNIQTLYNINPPATDEDIRTAAGQYVRKISGFRKPSRVNQAAFEAAVEAIASASQALLAALQTDAPRRDRAVEAARVHARAERRFSRG